MDAHIGNCRRAYIRKHKAARSGSYRVPRTDSGRGSRTGNPCTDSGRGARSGNYRVPRTDSGTDARTESVAHRVARGAARLWLRLTDKRT